MRAKFNKIIFKLSGFVAGLAVLFAISNVNSTCMFASYQPDVPEELK